MLPDTKGNTILHYLCDASSKELHDLIRWLVQEGDMRLTPNLEGHTPLALLKAHPSKRHNARSAPNMRKETTQFLEEMIAIDPSFIDSPSNAEIHTSVIRGDSDEVEAQMKANHDNLELRNPDGKTPLMLAIQHDREDIAQFLLKYDPNLKLKDSREGNTVLHIASKKG